MESHELPVQIGGGDYVVIIYVQRAYARTDQRLSTVPAYAAHAEQRHSGLCQPG